MKQKINNYLEKASLLKLYFIGVLIFFTMFMLMFGLTIGTDPDAVEGVMMRIFILSIIVGLILGGVLPSMVGMARQFDAFYEVAKPLMERAENCDTIKEWESIVTDVNSFHKTHKYGKLNNKYLNQITNVLSIKKKYMK
jgi:hypothetical protein